MIMRRGQPLLMPANPLFIWGSLVVAFVLNALLNIGMAGRAAWMPDLVGLLILFWGVHQPRRIGLGVAFVFGLAMDVQQTTLLGQHALSYLALSYLAISIQRRLLWYDVGEQTLQLVPVLLVANAIALAVRLLAGGMWPGWGILAAPLFEALLWPLATAVLLAPQRRPVDPDDNRPL